MPKPIKNKKEVTFEVSLLDAIEESILVLAGERIILSPKTLLVLTACAQDTLKRYLRELKLKSNGDGETNEKQS